MFPIDARWTPIGGRRCALSSFEGYESGIIDKLKASKSRTAIRETGVLRACTRVPASWRVRARATRVCVAFVCVRNSKWGRRWFVVEVRWSRSVELKKIGE